MSPRLPKQVSADQQSDLALCCAASAGEELAQQRLADRLFDRVNATVSYLAGGDPDADDLVQLSLVEILRSAGSFRAEGNLKSWADRITVRTCMRFLKKRRWSRETLHTSQDAAVMESEIAIGGGLADGSESLEQQADRRQIHGRLAGQLQKLKPEWRVVVLLRWVHGYSIEEIAELTGARPNTVRGHLRRGKRQLRKLILGDSVLREWEPLVEP